MSWHKISSLAVTAVTTTPSLVLTQRTLLVPGTVTGAIILSDEAMSPVVGMHM